MCGKSWCGGVGGHRRTAEGAARPPPELEADGARRAREEHLVGELGEHGTRRGVESDVDDVATDDRPATEGRVLERREDQGATPVAHRCGVLLESHLDSAEVDGSTVVIG